MEWLFENWIAIVAAFISILSALYARWSYSESVKANNISRLNALFAFRTHYIELSSNILNSTDRLQHTPLGMGEARKTFGEIDEKLREINAEITAYHDVVIKNKL